MKHRQMKLELTWTGKEMRMRSRPHTLVENTDKSYSAPIRSDGVYDNKLISGDNLVALDALKQEFGGKVKCIYIDPPYNIDATDVPYDDSIEQSVWLSLMRDRLEILRCLLSDDGLIFIQINDEMVAHLTLVMDELFGKENKLNVIAVKMSDASGVKMAHADKRLPKLKEYILVYRRLRTPKIDIEKIPLSQFPTEYRHLLLGINKENMKRLRYLMKKGECNSGDLDECRELLSEVQNISLADYFKENNMKEKERKLWRQDNVWRIFMKTSSPSVLKLARQQKESSQDVGALLSPTGLIYLYKIQFNKKCDAPNSQIIFADDALFRNPCDFWSDIKTGRLLSYEGNVSFPNSKKPEALLKRIIGMCSNPGDIVLDCFAGSGTTLAVAHKMGRRWIGIELGEHCDSHCVPRLKKVVDGTDQTGVSKEVSWNGGGGFRYYHLQSQTKEK